MITSYCANSERGNKVTTTTTTAKLNRQTNSKSYVYSPVNHLKRKHETVAATCADTRAIDRSSRAGYRSILVLTS